RFSDAVDAYRTAITCKTDWPAAHKRLGDSYERMDRLREALAAYKEAVGRKLDYAEAHYALGLLYLKAGDQWSASAELQILQNLRSDFADKLRAKLSR